MISKMLRWLFKHKRLSKKELKKRYNNLLSENSKYYTINSNLNDRILELEDTLYLYEIEFPFHLGDTVLEYKNNFQPVIVSEDNYFELKELLMKGNVCRASDRDDPFSKMLEDLKERINTPDDL